VYYAREEEPDLPLSIASERTWVPIRPAHCNQHVDSLVGTIRSLSRTPACRTQT